MAKQHHSRKRRLSQLLLAGVLMGGGLATHADSMMEGHGPEGGMKMMGGPGPEGDMKQGEHGMMPPPPPNSDFFGPGSMMGGGEGMHGPGHMLHFLRGLHLTEEQQDKVFNLVHAQAPVLHEQGKAFHKAREALRQLALSDQYDDAKAKTLAEEGARAGATMAEAMAATGHQIYLLLSPEQRKQMSEKPQWCDHKKMEKMDK